MSNKIYLDKQIYPMEISDYENKVGVPEGFFYDLQNENDWSFIIKLHALIESACTQLLTFHFNDDELKDIFSRLELSNKTTGKVAFLKKCNLLGEEYRRYICSLSELRNQLVHNIDNCNYSLTDMINKFSESELKTFAINFSPYETLMRSVKPIFQKEDMQDYHKEIKEQSEITNIIKRAKKNPKFHIFIGAYNLLIHLIDMHGFSDFKQSLKIDKYMDSCE